MHTLHRSEFNGRDVGLASFLSKDTTQLVQIPALRSVPIISTPVGVFFLSSIVLLSPLGHSNHMLHSVLLFLVMCAQNSAPRARISDAK